MSEKEFNITGGNNFSEMLKPFQEYWQQLEKSNSFLNYAPKPIYNMEAIAEAVNEGIQNLSPGQNIPEEYFEKTLEYQKKSLDFLQSINENTANLFSMVELINKNVDNQDQIISLLSEIMNLAKAGNKEEAATGFSKVMKKITDVTSDAETLMKLTGWATAIYEAVSTILPNIPV